MGRKKKNEKEAFVADLHDIMDGAGTMKDTEIAEAFVAKGWCKRSEGEWVRRYSEHTDHLGTFKKYDGDFCSVCGVMGDGNFCPNCGSKMKGV